MVGRLARPVIGLILLAMLAGVAPAASADPEPPGLWRQVVELVRGIGAVVEATGHTAQVIGCVLQARDCDDEALKTDSVDGVESLEDRAARPREQADQAAAAVEALADQAAPPPTGDGTGQQPPGWADSIIRQHAAATRAMNDKVGRFADQVEQRGDDLRRAREASPIIVEYQRLADANLERVGQPDRPLSADLADIDKAVRTTAWLLERLNEVQGTYRTSAGARRQIDRARRDAIRSRERILDEVISYLDGHLDRLGGLNDAELRDVVDRLHDWVTHLVEQAERCENGGDCDRLLDRAGQLLDRSEQFVEEIERRAAADGAQPDSALRDRIQELRAEIHAQGMDPVLDRYTAWLEQALAERAAKKAAEKAAEKAAKAAAQAAQATHAAHAPDPRPESTNGTGEQDDAPPASAAEISTEPAPAPTTATEDALLTTDAAAANDTPEQSLGLEAGDGTGPGLGEDKPTVDVQTATVKPSEVGPVVPLRAGQPAKVSSDDDPAERTEGSAANGVVDGVLGGKVASMASGLPDPGVIADPVPEASTGQTTGFPVAEAPTATGCAGPLAALCKEDGGPNVLVQVPGLPIPSMGCLSVTGFCGSSAPGGIDLDIWQHSTTGGAQWPAELPVIPSTGLDQLSTNP